MNLDADAYPSDRQRVAANVRAEVARRGLSQTALAEILQISQTGVSRRLSGRTDFTASELAVLAKRLRIPAGTFFASTALAEGGDAA